MEEARLIEEPVYNATVESLVLRVKDLQNSILDLLAKLQMQDQIKWPQLLESFAVISGQISTVHNILRNEKTPLLKSFCVLPLRLSLDFDPELQKQTDGRISAFTHQVAPDYLRTKPEPEVEVYENSITSKASIITAENVQKQINQLNKCVNCVLDAVSASSRDDWDPEAVRLPQTYSASDTQLLISAVSTGRSLKGQSSSSASSAVATPVQPAASAGGGKTKAARANAANTYR